MNLSDQLIRDEGLKLNCYQDTEGNWTVGVGHKVSHNVGCITEAAALQQLDADIYTARSGLASALDWFLDLDTVRQDALINMAFNLGVKGLLKWTTFLGLMHKQDFQNAGIDLMHNPKWDNQVKQRANRIAEQIETGVYV